MSARDDAHGGRFEPERMPIRGEGQPTTGRCDECQRAVTVRHPAKVMKGPLRGLRGRVCVQCMDARKAVAA